MTLLFTNSKSSPVAGFRPFRSGERAFGWHHVVGVLGEDKTMRLYVDGKLEAEGTAHKLIASDPAQAMEIGLDAQSSVGDYKNIQFSGIIDDVRLYFDEATGQQISERFQRGTELGDDAVLAVGSDDGT